MFWKEKPLDKLSHEEWESLCDGCAKCCLHKLIDPITNEVGFTWAHCQILDSQSCQCTDYQNRLTLVPGCIKISSKNLPNIVHTLPRTCAYRLVFEGKDLPDYHPLICGSTQLIHELGNSIQGKSVSENDIEDDDLELFLVEDEDF